MVESPVVCPLFEFLWYSHVVAFLLCLLADSNETAQCVFVFPLAVWLPLRDTEVFSVGPITEVTVTHDRRKRALRSSSRIVHGVSDHAWKQRDMLMIASTRVARLAGNADLTLWLRTRNALVEMWTRHLRQPFVSRHERAARRVRPMLSCLRPLARVSIVCGWGRFGRPTGPRSSFCTPYPALCTMKRKNVSPLVRIRYQLADADGGEALQVHVAR